MGKKTASLLLVLALCLALPMQAFAYKIVVDAGHGGTDPGAVGAAGLQEKAVNLDIATKLKQALVQSGYDVYMTRTSDKYISLSDRVELTDSQNADLFVSIHANSYTSSAARGATVLYYDSGYPNASYPASEAMKQLTPQSKLLAQHVLDAIIDKTGFTNLGLMPSSVYVVRMGSIPSILVETAFLSNKQDEALLADENVRQQLALAVKDGIEQYMPAVTDKTPNVLPDSIGHWAREAIVRLNGLGIVQGTTGNRFEPNRSITRAEWIALLDRVFGIGAKSTGQAGTDGGAAPNAGTPASSSACADMTVNGSVYGTSGSCAKTTFPDLTPGHWAYSLMTKAASAGFVDGYGDGTLRPDQPVTRAEAAALLQRIVTVSQAPASAKAAFTDVTAGHWAASAIYALKQAGIVGGVTDTQFMPAKAMSRAEAVALLDRCLQSGSKQGAAK